MVGYTKLFSSIVHSTIWRQEDHVRLVWVTMLAMADKNGVVESSIPGLADLSRVSLDQCVDALNLLKDPDPYSRSQEHEGRRITDVDGGWVLLNYVKYREKLKSENARILGRERQRKWRERNAKSNASNASVMDGNVTVTPDQQSESESTTESKERKTISLPTMTNKEQEVQVDKTSKSKDMALNSKEANRVLDLIVSGWPDYDPIHARQTAAAVTTYYKSRIDVVAVVKEAIVAWPPGRSVTAGNGVHGFVSSFCANKVKDAVKVREKGFKKEYPSPSYHKPFDLTDEPIEKLEPTKISELIRKGLPGYSKGESND